MQKNSIIQKNFINAEKFRYCRKIPKNPINAGKCPKLPLIQENAEKFH
jgi:hypothetical protein